MKIDGSIVYCKADDCWGIATIIDDALAVHWDDKPVADTNYHPADAAGWEWFREDPRDFAPDKLAPGNFGELRLFLFTLPADCPVSRAFFGRPKSVKSVSDCLKTSQELDRKFTVVEIGEEIALKSGQVEYRYPARRMPFDWQETPKQLLDAKKLHQQISEAVA